MGNDESRAQMQQGPGRENVSIPKTRTCNCECHELEAAREAWARTQAQAPGPPGGATAIWQSCGSSVVPVSWRLRSEFGLPRTAWARTHDAKPRIKGGFERRGQGLPRQARGGGACCMLHVRLVATVHRRAPTGY